MNKFNKCMNCRGYLHRAILFRIQMTIKYVPQPLHHMEFWPLLSCGVRLMGRRSLRTFTAGITLGSGETKADFQTLQITPSRIQEFHRDATGRATTGAKTRRIQVGILSGPDALLTSSLDNRCSTLSTEILNFV